MESKKMMLLRPSPGLKYFSCFCLIYGIDFNPSCSKVRKCAIIVLRLCITMTYISDVIGKATSLSPGLGVILDIQKLWYVVSAFVSFWVMQRNVAPMKQSVVEYLILKPTQDISANWSLFLVAIYVVYFLFDVTTSIMVKTRKGLFAIIRTTVECYLGGCWTMFCFLLFSAQVLLISRLNDIFFQHYIKESNKSVRGLRIICHRIREIKYLLDDRASLIPLLWLGNIFIKSFANGVALKYNVLTQSTTFTFFLNYWYLIQETLHVLLLILYLDHVNSKAQGYLLEFRRECLKYEHNQELELLFAELETSVSIRLTGWSMFTLNKEFVLSFISALISFSILFIQLVGEPEKVV